MKLGLHLGYFGAQPPPDPTERILEAERLGYDSVWTSESWGSDALTPLTWWGARTSKVRLGTAVAQLSARQPTAAAMAALTLDHLSNGRFVLGLGVSGPQVVEGWYGQPFEKPLARTREYLSVIRDVLEREGPVTNDGPHYPLPLPDGTGLGKPLKSITHPLRADLPIFLGAQGPKNATLAAEIADGWFPIYYAPTREEHYRACLTEGWSRPQARRAEGDFEILPTVAVVIDHDLERAADVVRPTYALYIGGMGARDVNFHFDVFCRLGYEAEATKIQELYLAGHKDDAIAAVPTEMIDELCLIGPRERIRDSIEKWRESLATTLIIDGSDIDVVRTMAELVL